MALAMAPDVVEIALEPKTSADQERLDLALKRLAAEDPSFQFTTDHDLGQTIVKGARELQLESFVDRMRREFKVEANVGAPQVAYRETLSRTVEVDYTHKVQFGGSAQFGRVMVTVAPARRGSGILFFDKIKGGNIPREYIPSVEKACARRRKQAP
jgi:elongation factor G